LTREGDWKLIERGMAAAMSEGSVSIPVLLLRLYRYMKLNETEAMLLIHLILFKEKEGKEFPTIEELQSRMSCDPNAVIGALQRLVKDQFLQIDDEIDPVTRIRSERYNLAPLYRKLAAAWAELSGQESAADARSGEKARLQTAAAASRASAIGPGAPAKAGLAEKEPGKPDIFTIFEQEFARPLTPMECETISQWLDKDKYPEPLIILALKEAVFAGAVHFRYIDRILLEWQRNRVQTPEQAKEYAQKFRGMK